MIYHNLAEIYSSEELILNRLQLRVNDLPPEQLNHHSDNGTWSIAEIVEHVSIVDTQLLKLITKLLQNAEVHAGDIDPIRSFPIDVESLVERSRKEKYVARDNAQPTGEISISDALQIIERIHTELVNLRARLEKVNLSSVCFPHWVWPFDVGPMARVPRCSRRTTSFTN